MDPSQPPGSSNSGPRRGSRGSTMLSKLSKECTSKKKVEYNELGQPIGAGSIMLSSYCGSVGRSFVPITIDDWRKVPNEIKEKCWIAVSEKFELDKNSKKMVLQNIGSYWKDFKNILTTKYIWRFIDDHSKFAKPPSIYPFIEQSQWDIFVKKRLSQEFAEQRQAHQEIQAKNIYAHHMSRKGYARFKEELKATENVDPDEDISRGYIWKKARQDKKGEYFDNATKEKAERIDELTQQLKEGNISFDGCSDALTMALETQEHPGRVRGVGGLVTPTSYFNIPRRKINNAHLHEKIRVLEEENKKKGDAIEKMEARFEQMQSMLDSILASQQQQQQQPIIAGSEKVGSNKKPPSRVPTRESRSPPSPHIKKAGQGKKCRLFINNETNIVAFGTFFEPKEGDMIHGIPLHEGSARVSICDVIKPSVPLPYPRNDEHVFIEDGLGSYVEWPGSWILPIDEHSADPSSEITEFARSYRGDFTDTIFIEFDESVFCSVFTIQLSGEDIVFLADMEQLSASCITVYMGYLADQLIYRDKGDVFGFANPYIISESFKFNGGKYNDFIIELAKLYKRNKERLNLVPLNIGSHWVLIVTDFSNNNYYFFDSLGLSVRPTIRTIFNKTIQYLKKEDKSNRLGKPNWINVQCPRQPNNIECGYYVLRNMKEIIENEGNESSIVEIFTNEKAEYSKEEIDEVRLEWIEKVKEYINL